MPIQTDGPLLEPDNKGIDEFHVGYGSMLGATAAQAWEDSPVHQLLGIHQLDQAGDNAPDFGEISTGIPTGPQLADATKPATPRMDIIDANDRVKKAGLAPHLKLPDQPDIAPAQLSIMMERAQRRRELETTIDQGPQGFIPGALNVGTSFLVGAADPLNLASAFVPVMGELRYGKLLASAGESALARGLVRAEVGAAQGALGQAALEPLDWYSRTQDGRDFGMADVLHNILFGAVLGGGLQTGGGAIADVYRGRRGRAVYPYGPGEPLEGTPQRVPLGPETVPLAHPEVTNGAAEVTAAAPEVTPGLESAPHNEEIGPPSPEVQTINDLPAQAHEDAMRGAISDLINGTPVRAGEMLEAGAQADSRIAESFEAHSRNAELTASGARETVFDDIHAKLLAAGMNEDEAGYNAAIVAARYATRAERLGGAQNAVDLYRAENISIGTGESAAEGRTFHQAQPQAPAFYSAVDRALTAARQDKGTPEQWLGTLKNAAGVKPEEMKWLGLEDWLREQNGSVSRQQIQDYVRANAIEVKEVAKDLNLPGLTHEKATRYDSYILPGGENYRELLLTLPGKPDVAPGFDLRQNASGKWAWFQDDRQVGGAFPSREEAATHQGEYSSAARRDGDNLFRSSHWEEPNVLAHIRFDDRISDGKKTLHLAEVQSDWHQAGKRKGYQTEYKGRPIDAIDHDLDALQEEHGARGEVNADDPWANADDLKVKYDDLMAERFKAQDARDGWSGVPDAPFKTTWPELAMKRMIRYAAEHGYDRVSWDTGATNAERYDLSKQVDRISYSRSPDGTYSLSARKGNEEIVQKRGLTEPQLEEAIGKDAAKKVVDNVGREAGEPAGAGTLTGLDLKVGGEGMAGFYDRILPATVNKMVKKFGAKVEEGRMPTGVGKDERWALRDATDQGEGEIVSTHATREAAEREAEEYGGGVEVRELPVGETPVHSLTITPDLRNAAMEQGFPLFQGGGDNPRGRITLADNRAIIDLYQSADASTFMHESGHLWLDELMRDAAHAGAPAALRADRDAVLGWLGVQHAGDIGTAQHERWAEGFEQYLRSGEAPSSALAKAFEQFKQWITEIYRALARTGQEISPEIRGVMDRLLASDAEIADRGDELGATTRAVTKTPRGRAAADPQTWSLFEYLASKGGLKPDPELEAIFGGKRGPMIGGFGPLLRRDGMALDEALRVAKEGHYLFDAADVTGAEARLTPRDLLDMVDREGRGQKVYRMDHVSPDREIGPEEEARHIVAALHDELESGGGAHAVQIDPRLESRVVEIVQKEGGTDVLAAYERAIMEDAERYEGLSDARRQIEATRHLPGWDAAESAAASGNGAADRGGSGQAGFSAARAGAADGGQPRATGAGDRAPVAPQLDRQGAPPVLNNAAAWRQLASTTPEFDSPEIVAASKAADEVPKPPSKLQERVTASEKADGFAKQMYDMFAHRLPEQDRTRLDDLIKRIDDDHEAREIAIVRGGSCLFGVV